MFTFRKALVSVTVLAASLAATSSPAAAVDYPDPVDVQLDLDVAHCQIGGTFLEIHARATSGGDDVDGTMKVTAVGKSFEEPDNDLRVNVKTPVVTSKTKFKVTARFIPTDNADASVAPQSSTQVTTASYSTTKALATAFRSAYASETITLVPRSASCSSDNGDDTDNGGLLPDTGGISIWYFILGAFLLVAGAVTLMASRKRTKNSV